ncbi:shikimate O-hydroxycinnamoyltransferase-like [Pyrus ussuriensis x Pyrus communis]|uniref:Shikimate O-hydroxycinnamoyltransferase-like n=1 Tax=Pyrus ussuriensis x Pyrus communis TaxID=2448454 RepID=A0A5N5GF63_9ROSA|nr:shikimate O-hydroxycinnamoyltransferase-like [Pyrus ussuriensis x Pyrus communis]
MITRSTIVYSTYEILAGHVWKCGSNSGELPDDRKNKLHVVDGRSRLQPPLPLCFFGNVIVTATLISWGDLQSKQHDTLQQIDFLELQPDLSALVRGAGSLTSPNIGITSWVGVPSYVFLDGVDLFLLSYSGSANNGGSLSVAISLQSEHMKSFSKLFYDIY